jgi:GGDEF domain-containing protein
VGHKEMKHLGTNGKLELHTSNELTTDNNNIIDKCSILTFYDTNLNKTSIHVSNPNFPEMNHFTTSAERLLNNNPQNYSYTMIVFDINLLSKINETYNHVIYNALIKHVFATLQANIQEPNLFCQINDDNFAIFVENYKAIDIALFVINLTEEISSYNSELTIKLTFGSCPADYSKMNISTLSRLAFYAKSTLNGQSNRLLADYNELVFHKKMARN